MLKRSNRKSAAKHMCKRTTELILSDKLYALNSVMLLENLFLNLSNEVSRVYTLTIMEPKEDRSLPIIFHKTFILALPRGP